MTFSINMYSPPEKAPEYCALHTGNIARFRDPHTLLPYCHWRDYREIQRLKRGDYKWSGLLEAYVGQATHAARGVPARFLRKAEPLPAVAAVTAPVPALVPAGDVQPSDALKGGVVVPVAE